MWSTINIPVQFRDLGTLRKNTIDDTCITRGIPTYKKKDHSLQALQASLIDDAVSAGHIQFTREYSLILPPGDITNHTHRFDFDLSITYSKSGRNLTVESYKSWRKPSVLTVTAMDGDSKKLYSTNMVPERANYRWIRHNCDYEEGSSVKFKLQS